MTETPTTPPAAPATVTPAAAWHKPAVDGELYRLPGSGNVAKLRMVSLMAIAAGIGIVPNPLAQEVVRWLAVSDAATKKTEGEQIADYRQNTKAYIAAAQMVMISPKLITDRTPDYDADEIGPADLHDRDYTWILNVFLMQEASARLPFRVG